jgi:hypothetical protein
MKKREFRSIYPPKGDFWGNEWNFRLILLLLQPKEMFHLLYRSTNGFGGGILTIETRKLWQDS